MFGWFCCCCCCWKNTSSASEMGPNNGTKKSKPHHWTRSFSICIWRRRLREEDEAAAVSWELFACSMGHSNGFWIYTHYTNAFMYFTITSITATFQKSNLLSIVLLFRRLFWFVFYFMSSSSSCFFSFLHHRCVLSLNSGKTNSPDLKDFIILLCQQQQFRLVNYILLMSINVQVTVMNTHWTSMLIQKENPKRVLSHCLTLLFALLFIHLQQRVCVFSFYFIIVIISKFEMFENPLAASTSLIAMTM